MIRVSCSCGKVLQAPDRLAGKKAKCPGCGKVLDIAQPAAKPDDFFEDEKPYEVDVPQKKNCSKCGELMGLKQAVCLSCGFNMVTGEVMNLRPREEAKAKLVNWGKMIRAVGLFLVVAGIAGALYYVFVVKKEDIAKQVPDPGIILNQPKNAERTKAQLEIQHSIQAYQAQKGEWPKTLEDMGDMYIPPPAGMEYKYDSKEGKATVVDKPKP